MIILQPKRLRVEYLAIQTCLVMILTLCLVVIGLFFGYPWSLSKSHLQKEKKEKRVRAFALDAIGSGSLTLNPKITYGWISRVAENVCVFAMTRRPDLVRKERKFFISVGEQKAVVKNGETIYLQEERRQRVKTF